MAHSLTRLVSSSYATHRVTEDGPGVLLVNKSALRAFLSQHDSDIVWTVLGEKGLIGGRIGHDY